MAVDEKGFRNGLLHRLCRFSAAGYMFVYMCVVSDRPGHKREKEGYVRHARLDNGSAQKSVKVQRLPSQKDEIHVHEVDAGLHNVASTQ